MNQKITGVLLALATLTLVVFAAGCIGTADQTAKVNDMVNVFYTLTLEDGTVHETNVGKTPLTFVVGTGQMIKGFDEAIIGMKPGETKNVTLPPDQAYGEYNNESVYVLPKTLLESYTSEPIVPGLNLTMMLYSGSPMFCEVVAVDEESGNVGLLINHQLAGKTLTFEITLDSIGEKST
ncbi:MAG: FKBP-type peptidyl-prolyl cis-trans isomerase, partial [Methanocalculaceae archaeon]|nr:FKBP-type peptidyl-prolyl cis-trans isomerase [Methanocalculaceae archaeon]